jgi:Mrp family chromosome partitioning ATPase/capsular polysaccharide biosynthesis protein
MDLLSYFRALRRRWILILLLVVVGGGLGVASTLFDKGSTKSRTYYKATNTLVLDTSQPQSGGSQSSFTNLDQIALLATTGEVPDAVAKKLANGDSGRQLSEHITTTANGNTTTLAITAAEPESGGAVRLANAFADALVKNLNDRDQARYNKDRDAINARLAAIQAQENLLLAQLKPGAPNFDVVKAQYDATVNSYRLAYDSFQQLATAGPPATRLSSLERAQAVPINATEYTSRLNLGALGQNNLNTSTASSDAPTIVTTTSGTTLNGPVARGLLGAFLGLLAGIGLALLAERLDRRIRTREDAEAAYELPVLAEVPLMTPVQQKDMEIVSLTSPLSRAAESYRAIRSSLLFQRAVLGNQESSGKSLAPGNSAGMSFDARDEPFVVMVTSASPSEGKTTTTANLAVVFAESGASVLVVNCDFRRPAIHMLFGMEDEPRRVLDSSISGLKIVTNVHPDPAANPAQVVSAQRQVVAAARGRFDIVLLDTAPLLTANDAIELVTSADLVLLVARTETTTSDNARRAVEVLGRLEAPMAGVVLVGASSASGDNYYYYYQAGRIDGAAELQAQTGKQPDELPGATGDAVGGAATNGEGHTRREPSPFFPGDSDHGGPEVTGSSD